MSDQEAEAQSSTPTLTPVAQIPVNFPLPAQLTRDEKLRLRTCKIYSKDVAMLKFAKFAQLCTALNLKIDNSFTLLHSYHCRRGNT